MKKVIVTGATGFIGSALTKKLLSNGVIVYGVDIDFNKLETMKQYGDFRPIVADFTKYNSLSELILDRDFDVFFHFAWQGVSGANAKKDYTTQINNVKYSSDATMQAVEMNCKKFVYSSSINQLETMDYLNISNNKTRYSSIYSITKFSAESICKIIALNNNLAFNSGMLPMIYGEGNMASTSVINIIINQLNNNISPRLIEGNDLFDLVYISDVVRAFISIGDFGINGKGYYIGHKEIKTFKEIFTDIRNIIAPNIEMKFGEYKDTNISNYQLIDLNELYTDTGFECKSDFKESILKTSKWIKQNAVFD